MEIEKQFFSTEFDIKKVSELGEFEGYASVFGDLDSYQDIVARGAFKSTLSAARKKGRMPAMLWQHDIREPIGVWKEMREDDTGLYVKGQLLINDVARAKAAHALLREGGLSGMSIGYRAVESEYDDKKGIRTLVKVDLLEVSLVTFPALDSARVSAVKEGKIPTEREFEAFLRDAGFSHKQAKTIISSGFRAISQRDAGEHGEEIAKLLNGFFV